MLYVGFYIYCIEIILLFWFKINVMIVFKIYNVIEKLSEYFYFYVFSIYYLLFIGVVSVLNYCKDWNEKYI